MKDKQSRIYSDTIFFLSSISYTYPIFIIINLIVLTLYYFITELNKDNISSYLWFLLFFLWGGYLNGSVLGVLAGVVVDEKKHIGAVIPILVLPFFIVAGFF